MAETIREFAAAGRPWHIWADYEEPHLPCRPSAPFADMYDPASIEPWDGFDDPFVNKPYCHRQQAVNWQLDGARWADVAPMVARYYGVISQLDDAIGKILAALEETGQAGNTIVAFTSDHGDMCGSHRMLDKHYVLYDDIVRVPLIVRHPDYAPWRCDSFQSNALDLPASFVRWLSLPDPGGMHGAPLPRSAAEDENPRACITSSGNGQQMGLHSIRMLRDDRCKYVWNLTDVDELYDLTDDPGELNNLIARPDLAGRVADMRRALYADLQAHGDRLVGNEWTRRQLLDNRKLPAR
ncbi:MAG: sulfatase-like hydrolase/transferase [Clostridiales bacterium]|nr:sulfatase-like hydrolase/transferase [Clostridiales bacterium]